VQTRDEASWDLLAEELARLRLQVGSPSYEKVARMVTDRRIAQGTAPYAARVARSTVYDCFSPGRTRVNLPLVREIALALGSSDATVDEWLARCHQAASPLVETSEEDPLPEPVATSRRRVVLLLVLCVLLNLGGRVLVDSLTLPAYLDMVGTAIAAVALGPWHGAIVGVCTNVLGVASSGPASLDFVPVNVVGALVWGYGVHRFDMGRSLQRYFLLNVLAGLACTLVAVPILYLAFGGLNGNGADFITETIQRLTGSNALGVTLSNTLVSQVDKLISGFVALVVVISLPRDLRRCRGWLFTHLSADRPPA
jgi:energy-coupling factor transport system substrate-specific component